MFSSWVRSSSKAINVSTLGAFLHQDSASAPTAQHPHPCPYDLRIVEGASASTLVHGVVIMRWKAPGRRKDLSTSQYKNRNVRRICRDRGCVDDGWGRLRCPGRSDVSTMYPPWVRSSSRAINVSIMGAFLQQGNQCLHRGCVPPAGQSMYPLWVRSSSRAINVSTVGAFLHQDSASAPAPRHPLPCPYRSVIDFFSNIMRSYASGYGCTQFGLKLATLSRTVAPC